MERYVRIAVPGAAAGLVLSVLIGLLSGVSLGTVMVRGLISAILFGGGGVGLFLLARNMLPGLTAPTDTPAAGDPEPPRKSSAEPRIDIVVEDDDDEAEVSREPERGDGEESPEEPVEGEPPAAVPERKEFARTDTSGLDEDEEAFAAEEEDSDELVEEVEEQSADDAEELMNQAIAEEKYGGGMEISDAVLDEMPDIGSFSGSFVDSQSNEESGDEETTGYSAFSSTGGGGSRRSTGSAGNDPETIAKALKTMLSRDDKE
jgi:hypothetical protein